jgi:hypothetical protein
MIVGMPTTASSCQNRRCKQQFDTKLSVFHDNKMNDLPKPDEVDFSQWYAINLIFFADEGEQYQLICQDHPSFLPRSARSSLEQYIFG